MKIYTLSDGDLVHRYKKSIVVSFAGKRNVLSTGPNNGGYREDLQAVFNNDANPGAGMACVMRAPTYEEHMNCIAADDLGLNPELCSGLCTAANMENVSIETLSCKDLTVTAIVTGGIEHNAGRAGDDATFYENGETFTALKPGTINIILHISASLDAGTLARAMVTCTEAKTIAIQELLAPSRYSRGIASGSGTDGTIVICNPASRLKLTNAGKNSKLGELIGKTVITAVKEALHRQSGLCPDYQHDIIHRMDRFGVTEDALWEMYHNRENTEISKISLSKAEFMDKLDHMRKDSILVTYTSLFAHLLDQYDWDMLDQKEIIPASRNLFELMTSEKDSCSRDINLIENINKDKTIALLCQEYMKMILGIIFL